MSVTRLWQPHGSREICRALTSRYPGVKFNAVEIWATSDEILIHFPDDDMVRIHFNVSGTAEALVRARFMHPSWLARLAPRRIGGKMTSGRIAHRLETEGFGQASSITRTQTGYRIHGASYDDALDRLAPLFIPQILEPWISDR